MCLLDGGGPSPAAKPHADKADEDNHGEAFEQAKPNKGLFGLSKMEQLVVGCTLLFVLGIAIAFVVICCCCRAKPKGYEYRQDVSTEDIDPAAMRSMEGMASRQGP